MAHVDPLAAAHVCGVWALLRAGAISDEPKATPRSRARGVSAGKEKKKME